MTIFSETLKELLPSREVEYTVLGDSGGYFQNVKRIAEFSPERILFCGKKGRVLVEGEGLSLGRYAGGDAQVAGRIESVRRLPDGTGEGMRR